MYIPKYYNNNRKSIVYEIDNKKYNIDEINYSMFKKFDLVLIIGQGNNINDLINKTKKYCHYYQFDNIKEYNNYIKNNNLNNKRIGIIGNISIEELNNYKSLLEFNIYYKKRLKELKNKQDLINNKLLYKDDNDIIQNLIKDFIDLNQDGKYIRATLISLGYYLATNQDNNYYKKLAYAYEMFQTAILIHDDIIDNSKIRRGKDTIQERIWKKYQDGSNYMDYQNDVKNLGNSLAMCIGDLGFYEVNKLIIKSYKNDKNIIKLLNYFNDAVIKTCKGEIIDVYLPFLGKYKKYNTKEKDILDIYHLKTSWYTIIGPFNLGYILGGKKPIKELDDALNLIGIIFQLKDDIIGIFGDDKTIGKSNASDIEEFKQTILYSYIIETNYKREFLSIYGKKNISDKDLGQIRKLLKLSGSYDYAFNMLNELKNNAINKINDLKINNNIKNILKGLLIYICIREK